MRVVISPDTVLFFDIRGIRFHPNRDFCVIRFLVQAATLLYMEYTSQERKKMWTLKLRSFPPSGTFYTVHPGQGLGILLAAWIKPGVPAAVIPVASETGRTGREKKPKGAPQNYKNTFFTA